MTDQRMRGPGYLLPLALVAGCGFPFGKPDDGRSVATDDSAEAAETGDDTGKPTETGDGTETGGSAETSDSSGGGDWADTGGSVTMTEIVEMSEADARLVLGGEWISGVFDATDVTGDGQAEVFLILNFNSPETDPEVFGFVEPGPSAMASTATSTNRDGLIEMIDDVAESYRYGALTFGSVGDVDGDGLPDVAFPQPTSADGPFVFSGATFSTARFTSGIVYTSEADLTINGEESSDDELELGLTALGAPVGGGTLQVSTWAWDTTGATVYLYPLPETGSSLTLDEAAAIIQTTREVDATGEVDVDGDGVPELLDLTSWRLTKEEPIELYVFDLPADGSAWTEAEARVTVKDPISYSGYDLYPATTLLPGDLDGDGLDDVILDNACHGSSGDEACYGTVGALTSLGLLSGTCELSAMASWQIVGSKRYSGFGAGTTLVPDVDGDHAPELLAFSYWSDSWGHTSDLVFLSSDLAGGGVMSERAAARNYDSVEGDNVAQWVASGDLDGDDNPELLFSYDNYGWEEGGAYIFSW